MNKVPVIDTLRLQITPCSMERLSHKLEAETDLHLRHAYGEMLRGMMAHPEGWMWYTDWDIVRKVDGVVVGGLGFKSVPDEMGRVEIGYGLDPIFHHQGYMGEALLAASDWALRQEKVRVLLAEVEAGNETSVRVLLRCGFQLISSVGNQFFAKEKR